MARYHYLCRALLVFFAITLFFRASEATQRHCRNPSVRREWGSLSKKQRRSYVDAVLCIQKKPSKFPPGLVPGARNRYDDFAATHINQTSGIHLNGVFLAWHREFVYLWETALRTECAYKGVQPYWDWPLWQSRGKLGESPLFDGSDTSLGGDGYPSNNYNCTPAGNWPNGTAICFPRANGGGCMKNGPFVNTKANLGPFVFNQAFDALPANWTRYNPRCLSRDLNDGQAEYLSYKWYNWTIKAKSIITFQDRLTNTSSLNGGMHASGHYAIGRSMYDFFASPYDPSFFVHHSGVDRIWAEWQAADPRRRVYGNNALFGTSTILNGNQTPPVDFDTVINWGYLGAPKALRESMSTTGGDYCYVYDN